MNFNHFRIKVVLLFASVLIMGFAAMYIGITSPHWKISVWLGILVVLAIISLIRLFESTKRELSDFLLEISHGDLSKTYQSDEKNDQLKLVFGEIMNVIKKLRLEKEINHEYLQTIVEHVNIALLCYDEDGEIVMANQSFRQLLNRNNIPNIQLLSKINPELSATCKSLGSGQKSLIKIENKGYLQSLSIQATEFKIRTKAYKLISLQDINAELELQELESWKKLVRVLTHEIMNTAIPISTLSNVINEMFEEEDGKEKDWESFNEKEQQNIKRSLTTIEKRSQGIVDFVRATKSFTHMAKPKFELVSVNEWVKSVLALYKPEFEQKNIRTEVTLLNADNKLKLDQNLMEQVLINLIRNSIEALEGQADANVKLELKCTEENRIQLILSDNGKGMNAAVLENIFIPFFTTKKEGSGIGLSLSKQIMQMHGGNIYVSSTENKRTEFSLIL